VLLLVLTGCQSWSQFGFGPGLAAFNPSETALSASTVGSLSLSWTADVSMDVAALRTQEPVVVDNVVYLSSWTSLAAFAASPGACDGGSPRVCAPLWTAPLIGTMRGSPAVVGSSVIVATDGLRIEAFDRMGTTGCSGVPKVCEPLWTASAGSVGSVTASGNRLFVNDNISGRLLAFDANGTANCSGTPKTCLPLWSSSMTGFGVTSPAVANGRVFAIGAFGGVGAFDANGVTGCSGVPVVCEPLWTASVGRVLRVAPVATNGWVYIATSDDVVRKNELLVFDAAGVANCGGAPIVCAPAWSAPLDTGQGFIYLSWSFAVDGSRVYVPAIRNLLVFSAHGTTNCAGTPVVCAPLWTASAGVGRFMSVSVANGVVYVPDGKLRAYAAGGDLGCSGSPVVCSPLFSSVENVQEGRPVTNNGRVFVITDPSTGSTGSLQAFTLP